MPKPFVVTTETNEIKLSQKRKAEATFTVTNKTGAEIACRGELLADNPESKDWLSVKGEAERVLDEAGTEAYQVVIKVPQDAPEGDYTFRFRAVAVADTDDMYEESKTITFSVPPPVKKIPWWIIAVVAGVLVVTGVILALVLGGKTDVPGVAGYHYDDAQATIQAAGLEIVATVVEHSNEEPKDYIIALTPPADETVKSGSGVTLVVSLGAEATPTPTPTSTPTPSPTYTPTPTSPPSSPVTVVEAMVGVPHGEIGLATAECPPGTTVTSGGYWTSHDAVVYSHFKHGNGWRAAVNNDIGSTMWMRAYATCLRADGPTSSEKTVAANAGTWKDNIRVGRPDFNRFQYFA